MLRDWLDPWSLVAKLPVELNGGGRRYGIGKLAILVSCRVAMAVKGRGVRLYDATQSAVKSSLVGVTCVACEEGVFCDGVELLWEDKTCPLLRERDRLNKLASEMRRLPLPTCPLTAGSALSLAECDRREERGRSPWRLVC